MSGTGSFLSRWSRLKRASETERPDEIAEQGVEDTAPVVGEVPGDSAQAGELIDEGIVAALPSIEDIGPGTDIRAFLQAGVPKALKAAALRRAWTANPLIANHVDPALDYAWDWNKAGAVPGSGGSLGLDRVRAMADRILAGEPKPDPAPDAVDPSDPAGPAEPADVLESPASVQAKADPPGALAESRPDVAARAKMSDETPDREEATQPAQRRSHGGAMPV